MREIGFRGKTTSEVWGYNQVEDGTWVYGFYRDEVGLPIISQFETERCDYIDYEIDRNTLGQYTGKKDKNGTKIFEGDILEYEFEDIGKQKAYVNWNSKYSSFTLEVISENFGYTPIESGAIIGNIYDNPELLEMEV